MSNPISYCRCATKIECRIDGKTYTMTQHGFFSHSEYEANQINDQEVVFTTLISNEEIAKQYPYIYLVRCNL